MLTTGIPDQYTEGQEPMTDGFNQLQVLPVVNIVAIKKKPADASAGFPYLPLVCLGLVAFLFFKKK